MSTQENEFWFVELGGKPEGGFSHEQVIQLIKDGKVSTSTLVWKKGLLGWEEASVHFPLCGNLEEEAASLPSPGIQLVSRNYWLGNTPAIAINFLILVLSVLLFFLIRRKTLEDGEFSQFALGWYSTLIFSCLSAGFLSWQLLLRAKRNAKLGPSSIQAGYFKLAASFVVYALFLFGFIFTVAGFVLQKVEEARNTFNTYTLSVDPAAHTIFATGTIGPRYARRIKEIIQTNPEINTLIIDSDGGLANEALETAHFIESIENFTVRAEGRCNSSCIFILVSAQNRLATWNLQLGLHAVSAIASFGTFTDRGVSKISEEASNYLLKRGVSETLVLKANQKGPDQLEVVNAIDLYESRTITGLIDGNARVDIDNAKWRFFEKVIRDADPAGVAEILTAIRETDQDWVRTYSKPMYAAYLKNDLAAVAKIFSEVRTTLTKRAVLSGEDAALYDYIIAQTQQTRHLVQQKKWQACLDYANGQIGEGKVFLSKELLSKEFKALASLIRSGALQNWNPKERPDWAETLANSTIESYNTKAQAETLIDKTGEFKNAENQCLYTVGLMEELLAQEPAKASELFRYLFSI